MRLVSINALAMALLLVVATCALGQTVIAPVPLTSIQGVAGTDFGVGSGGFRIGDINGDGFPDLITSSSSRPTPGAATRGCILVYYGDATGALPATPSVRLFNPGAPAGTLLDPYGNGFGSSYDVGDVNGDGKADVVVGATSEWGITAAGDTITAAGAVYIFFGSATLSGTVTTADVRLKHPDYDRPGRYITKNPSLRFGTSVNVGRFNGTTGAASLVVSEFGGAYSYIVSTVGERIDTVHALPDTIDNWSYRYLYVGPITSSAKTYDQRLGSYWHNTQGSTYGCMTGDFNGDGIMDYVVSCYGAYDLNVLKGPSSTTYADSMKFFGKERYGKFIFYLGKASLTSWGTFPDIVIPKQDTGRTTTPGATGPTPDSWNSELSGYLFNNGGLKMGDYNGDGKTDFITSNIFPRGIFRYITGMPQKWVFFGGATFGAKTAGTLGSTVDNQSATGGIKWRLAYLGSPGDINADGKDDFLGSSHVDSTGVDPVNGKRVNGEYYVYPGGASVTDAFVKLRPNDPRLGGPNRDAQPGYGYNIGQPLWDMNGDGKKEWAVMATSWGDSTQGKIYIYRGGTAITSVDDDPLNIARQFTLEQNYPNPFNPSTTISYKLPIESNISITIFNLLGQQVRTLLSARQPAGEYQIAWDGYDGSGKAVSSGVYLYRLQTGKFIETKKMTLLK